MLQGKTAVVTGAAKGIGKAIALAFAKEGCNIVLNYHSSLDDETVQEFDSVIQTNLKGTFNMIRHASSIMLKQRSGAIINMSSVVGVMGNVGQANYAASKAGIIGLTKSTAKELAARGVTCNAIAPGFVETDMTAALSEDLQKQMLETIPLKRYGQVDDIAQAAVFLAKNTYITGQVLHVDGGMCM